MKKANNNDNRATVVASRKTARSNIIVAVIGASALIIVAIIGVFNNKCRTEVIENKKSEINDNLKSIDTVKSYTISKDSLEGNDNEPKQIEYLHNLNAIEDLINYNQYPQAYRAYLKIYDSLPLSLRSRISEQNIEKAKKKYNQGKWQEAALIMKENMEIIMSE